MCLVLNSELGIIRGIMLKQLEEIKEMKVLLLPENYQDPYPFTQKIVRLCEHLTSAIEELDAKVDAMLCTPEQEAEDDLSSVITDAPKKKRGK